MEVNKFISKYRFLFFSCCVAVFVVLLLNQFAKYMIFRELKIKEAKVITKRGTIYDRNKRILAVQTTLYNLAANKNLIKDPQFCAEILSPVIDIPQDKLAEKILNSKSNFIYLKKKMSESEKDLLVSVIDANKLEGLSFESVFNRTYPENALASTVIGFLGDDGKGLAGVEYSLQNILSPPPESNGYDGNGYNVYLSIDGNIQYTMEKIAAKTMEETQAESLMFLAVNAETGEILSYVNEPSANLSNFTRSGSEERIDRPANFIYEPGSVFKVFSMAAFLELGTVHNGDVYHCDGHFQFHDAQGRTAASPITCLHPHGSVTPRDIIRVSCNDGTAQIADKTNGKEFFNKLKEFGFGSKTGLPLPGEAVGLLAEPKTWSIRTKHTIAMGQEVGVSALQIIRAATAIANKGSILKLSLISKIEDKDGETVYVHQPKKELQVISENNAKLILDYMQTASTEGTGWRASINGVPIAVKTGTAQMANKDRPGYSKTDFVASCIGIFPADDPKIILYMAVVKPVGKTYGEVIAAPSISEAANEIIDYLGLERENAPTVGHSGRVPFRSSGQVNIKDKMPDLTGASKKQLLHLITKSKFQVIVEGEGYVYEQYPAPGTPLKEGAKIELHLR